jgi:hypothetical protein
VNQVIEKVCEFFGVAIPSKQDAVLPQPLQRKSASLGRLNTTDAEQQKTVLKFAKRIWQQYGVDGHGLIDESEARHFLNQYMSGYSGKIVLSEPHFRQWFSQLDRDGDGKIDMIEFAHGVLNF